VVRSRHPNKEIEAAVSYAESRGWSWRKVQGHAWGKLLCPKHDREGCKVFVWSTPSGKENHAKSIVRSVDRCPHAHSDIENENL
jgi:hypothetical protein